MFKILVCTFSSGQFSPSRYVQSKGLLLTNGANTLNKAAIFFWPMVKRRPSICLIQSVLCNQWIRDPYVKIDSVIHPSVTGVVEVAGVEWKCCFPSAAYRKRISLTFDYKGRQPTGRGPHVGPVVIGKIQKGGPESIQGTVCSRGPRALEGLICGPIDLSISVWRATRKQFDGP